jgi:hypothetical protein
MRSNAVQPLHLLLHCPDWYPVPVAADPPSAPVPLLYSRTRTVQHRQTQACAGHTAIVCDTVSVLQGWIAKEHRQNPPVAAAASTWPVGTDTAVIPLYAGCGMRNTRDRHWMLAAVGCQALTPACELFVLVLQLVLRLGGAAAAAASRCTIINCRHESLVPCSRRASYTSACNLRCLSFRSFGWWQGTFMP